MLIYLVKLFFKNHKSLWLERRKNGFLDFDCDGRDFGGWGGWSLPINAQKEEQGPWVFGATNAAWAENGSGAQSGHLVLVRLSSAAWSNDHKWALGYGSGNQWRKQEAVQEGVPWTPEERPEEEQKDQGIYHPGRRIYLEGYITQKTLWGARTLFLAPSFLFLNLYWRRFAF